MLPVHYFIIRPADGKRMKTFHTGDQIREESTHAAFLSYISS